MTDVSVRDLKNSLSEYLRRAQAGEEIVVVSRKRPVARLSPLQGVLIRKNIQTAALRRLRALPGVSWTGDKPELPNKLVKLRGSKLASEIVSEGRT